ncbi:MAG: precorrin-6y C5,15-methyltransferase (decarboxylating) subunit CbiE [Deltaproteobacteria bacterium]|jgi:precorrin-6Y C5,15-methyltransferase (decarboxylating)|nr:precorrin-6y C5,15-methyltransferase (decarboxylating) subunit CbiE [Deltaproteobacteria bacterium]
MNDTDNQKNVPAFGVTLMGLDGADDIGPKQKAVLDRATIVAGPGRWLKDLENHPSEKIGMGKLDVFLKEVEERSRNAETVVLASGDPNFYGIAKKLLTVIPPERVTILPSSTTVQKAFARLKTTWAGVIVESLHGREGFRGLWSALALAGRSHSTGWVALYTDPANSPGVVAERMSESGMDHFEMIVFEDLDMPSEKTRTMTLAEAKEASFSPLNLAVLRRTKKVKDIMVGAPEEAYEHEAGLITKSEVRACALSLLELAGTEVLWDVGAGSGSVSIEASLLLPRGEVWGLEKNPARIAQAKRNRSAFGAANVEFSEGEALNLLDSLPKPDRIFLGGGGGDLGKIIGAGRKVLSPGGIVVASVIGLDSLRAAEESLTVQGADGKVLPCVLQLAAARSCPLAGSWYFKPMNQIYLVKNKF